LNASTTSLISLTRILFAGRPDFHVLVDVGVLQQGPGQLVGGPLCVGEGSAALRAKISNSPTDTPTLTKKNCASKIVTRTCSKRAQLAQFEQ